MQLRILRAIVMLSLIACKQPTSNNQASYLDYSKSDSKLSGGAKLIPIKTPLGEFKVWTKRVGNNPTLKVLFLHGGPGATSEYFESADSYFPGAGIEYYYYDQLGSGRSDNPAKDTLWDQIGRAHV